MYTASVGACQILWLASSFDSHPFFAIAMVTVGNSMLDPISMVSTGFVPTAFDVSMNVEIGEEDQHAKHVPREQVLAPAGKVAVQEERVHWVGERDAELNLW